LLERDLRQRFPGAQVFMDVDSIQAGRDFVEAIEEALDSCAVLVVLIGRQWATLTDEDGRRRLDNPDDFVRFEVKTALERGVRVIPVLVDGAKPLRQQELPDELRKLARIHALELIYGRYQHDKDRLLDLIQQELAAMRDREEADRKARQEADRQAREEADRKARQEADRKAWEEAYRKARQEADRKAREEADRKAREEADRKAQEEADRKAREEADRKAQEEADRKARLAANRKAWQAARKAREEADRKAREEAVTGGPWDVHDDVPSAERIDFGSMLVPIADDCEVQVSMADDQVAWIIVVRGDSFLQLQALAAPKSGGLWADVRQEIADEVAKAGGQSEEAAGPFGAEVHAQIASPEQVPGTAGGLHPVRFLGVDGPRWLLRGAIGGPAASRPEIAAPLEQVFAGVVVARGAHPVPPRDILEIQLPAWMLRDLADQTAEPAGNRWGGLNPFERGPEITETR
jgi:hypothetical protein